MYQRVYSYLICCYRPPVYLFYNVTHLKFYPLDYPSGQSLEMSIFVYKNVFNLLSVNSYFYWCGCIEHYVDR